MSTFQLRVLGIILGIRRLLAIPLLGLVDSPPPPPPPPIALPSKATTTTQHTQQQQHKHGMAANVSAPRPIEVMNVRNMPVTDFIASKTGFLDTIDISVVDVTFIPRLVANEVDSSDLNVVV